MGLLTSFISAGFLYNSLPFSASNWLIMTVHTYLLAHTSPEGIAFLHDFGTAYPHGVAWFCLCYLGAIFLLSTGIDLTMVILSFVFPPLLRRLAWYRAIELNRFGSAAERLHKQGYHVDELEDAVYASIYGSSLTTFPSQFSALLRQKEEE